MSKGATEKQDGGASTLSRPMAGDALLALVLLGGLACVFALSQRLEDLRPAEDPFATYEEIYVAPDAARRMSLGFNGLVADWYWLRSLQYVGRKMGAHEGRLSLDDLSPLGVRNLGPMLEQATTLDPQFMAAYEFGAIVLPSIDRDAAVRLVEKGIRENPSDWRLRQHLGYIHWQAKRFREAGEAYREGAALPGAPAWMAALAAQVELDGGSRQVARELYARMHDESDDERVRALAAERLLQLQALDERDALQHMVDAFRSRFSRCPAGWREVAAVLRSAGIQTDASGAPRDPTGAPYALDASACRVKLDERTEIRKR